MSSSDEDDVRGGTAEAEGRREKNCSDARPDESSGDANARIGGDTGTRIGDTIERARTEPRTHAVALALAAVLGLALSWLHWLGLVLAGSLVAVVAPSVGRGAAYAVSVGVLVMVAFAMSIGDAVLRLPEMTPIVYVTVASAFGLPLFGSLARGLT